MLKGRPYGVALLLFPPGASFDKLGTHRQYIAKEAMCMRGVLYVYGQNKY